MTAGVPTGHTALQTGASSLSRAATSTGACAWTRWSTASRGKEGMPVEVEPRALLEMRDRYYRNRGMEEGALSRLVRDIAANFFGTSAMGRDSALVLNHFLTPPKPRKPDDAIVFMQKQVLLRPVIMAALAQAMLYEGIVGKPAKVVAAGSEEAVPEFCSVLESARRLVEWDLRARRKEWGEDREAMHRFLGDGKREALLVCFACALAEYGGAKSRRNWADFERALLAEKFGEGQFGWLVKNVADYVADGKGHMGMLLDKLQKRKTIAEGQTGIDASKKMPARTRELTDGGVAKGRLSVR